MSADAPIIGLALEAKMNLKKYRRTKNSVIGRIYSQQKSSSKIRKHNPPTYSKEWLHTWLINTPGFHKLYDIWVISNYEKNYKPSVDRINDDVGYTEYNIQLVTWAENNAKGHSARKLGMSAQGRICKKVSQYTLDGELVAEYVSLQEARRQTCINNISKCVNGKCKASGGYIWKFSKPQVKEP